MRQEPIDVVEALSVLMDLMDLADGPENQAELDELTGVILKLIPDYLAVYPEKKQAVLEVLHRSSGAQVTSLDSALAWYFKQPAAAYPDRPLAQPDSPDSTPEEQTPQPVKTPPPVKTPAPPVPKPTSTPDKTQKKQILLVDRFKQWIRPKPEAPAVTISNADEKRAALLKKLEAIRDGQNPFS